ncbi:MAG TPA: hypothetical protein VN626_11100 [Clostridia bacterium]|nr:hypothetical protein [Clostridia bacterium]
MIAEARAYLAQQLRAVMGEKTKIFLTEKELRTYMESHVGSVLIGSEALTVSGKKTSYGTGSSRRKYDRTVPLIVTIGEYNLEKLEQYYEAFLQRIDANIKDANGCWLQLEPAEAEWTDKDDQVLKANVSVILTVNCSGGIYQPVTTAGIKNYTVETQMVLNQEEEQNGI